MNSVCFIAALKGHNVGSFSQLEGVASNTRVSALQICVLLSVRYPRAGLNFNLEFQPVKAFCLIGFLTSVSATLYFSR